MKQIRTEISDAEAVTITRVEELAYELRIYEVMTEMS